MSKPFFIPDEWKERYRYAFEQARNDRPRYLAWIREEIEKAIVLINRFDKVAVLGGFAAKLIKSTPTLYTEFLANYEGDDKTLVDDEELKLDDDIEVLLEYAMNLAAGSSNKHKNVLPTQAEIDAIYDQLSVIKTNINFWEASMEPSAGSAETDHQIKTLVVQENINVRGTGYFEHVKEIFRDIYQSHNSFMSQFYGFTADEVLSTLLKLDGLVFSKIGNPEGVIHSQRRFKEWEERKGYDKPGSFSGMQFHIAEFVKENPDLLDIDNPHYITSYSLNSINAFDRIFWVIPENEKEKKIFERLSLSFGENSVFFESANYKGFLQGDTKLKTHPLLQEDGKYYHFSLNLGFRNIFTIAEELLREADAIYYENFYRGNAQPNTKDNCIEKKTKVIFENLIPNATFYHSLLYTTVTGQVVKENELDILGMSNDSVYIIEVKAGEYNTKIRRGALKGLKDKLKEIVGKGVQQSTRASEYIEETENPQFTYAKDGAAHTLVLDKSCIRKTYRIVVTFEQLSSVGIEFKNLLLSGIIPTDYKETWIVSIFDLMVFRDLIANEEDFKEYLDYRLELYDRQDYTFLDEIEIFGFYLDGGFPLPPVEEHNLLMHGYDVDISTYYRKREIGWPANEKPKKKQK